MRIITYSDLHLEFGSGWMLPPDANGDVMILAGDIITFKDYAPVVNPNTKHRDSDYMPAFNSLDMVEAIERHQPTLWVYGHTHECDDQTIGKTRIISNQLGYSRNPNAFECADFDVAGLPIEVG